MNDQPPPTPSTGDVWALVIEDMRERRELGIQRYGTPLQPHNGRDALVDAYQEVLDLAVYLRQAIEERNAPPPLSNREKLERLHEQLKGIIPEDFDAEKAIREMRGGDIQIRADDDGYLDEVTGDARVHLERMDARLWLLILTDGYDEIRVHFTGTAWAERGCEHTRIPGRKRKVPS